MQALIHNAFPLRFSLSHRLVALWATGLFLFQTGDSDGKVPVEKTLRHQEDRFERVLQGEGQNPVTGICQRERQDCVPKNCQAICGRRGKANCPGAS